jgi:hypothetical protein
VAQTLFSSGAASHYQSLQTAFRGRDPRAGIQFGSAFTWSHAIDDASDFFDSAGTPALPQDSLRSSETGDSSFDVRLRLANYFTWNPPYHGDSRLWKNWQLSGIAVVQSGQPFTVNSMYDINGDGNLTDRLNSTVGLLGPSTADRSIRLQLAAGVDPSQLFSSYGLSPANLGCVKYPTNYCDGRVGRNTFRTGGQSSLDLAVSRAMPIGERRIWIRTEIFNVVNHANFGVPIRYLEAPGFGKAVTTATPNRIIQLALRYEF